LRKALGHFQAAIEADPEYALAYSGLADCYGQLVAWTELRPKDGLARAKAAAAAAIALDDELAEAHASLGFVRANADWDWLAAESEFERAIKLDAGYWVAPYWRSVISTARGRYNESNEWVARARDLEPLSPVVAHGEAFNLIANRRHDEAVDVCLKAIELDPMYPVVRMWLGLAYEQLSRYDQAIAEFEKTVELLEGEPSAIAALAHTYAIAGRPEHARKALTDLLDLAARRYVDPYAVALVRLGLGDREQALDRLEKACEDRSIFFTYMANGDPRLDVLRPDRRFEQLLRRARLS
jgi:serine/threonine-protein kinase